jgi:hypothetical protein
MIEQFSYLNKEEQALVMDAPALVTIWIAGSTENVDQAELDGALDQINWRSIKARPDLLSYYQAVNQNFPNRLQEILQQLPQDKAARDAAVEEQLSKLNTIFPKFSQAFAEQLYASYQELARRAAESSGGFLGYVSVDSEEMERIHLPMIQDPRT